MTFYEENSKLLTPGAFEFVLESELKRAVRSQNYLTLVVLETAREVTGKSIPARVAPRRAGDPAVLIASSEKIKRELGWQPEFQDLGVIIESAWRWLQAHPNGYRK